MKLNAGWATKEFPAIEFKRTQDVRTCCNYVERATAVAQEQYKSLLTGLQAVGQVKGWKVRLIVFVGGTCGSIHVESAFNRNMKALGVLESKWDPIRKKLVRHLFENRTKCYGPAAHKREGHGARGGTETIARAGNMSMGHVYVKTARADRGQVTKSRFRGEHENWGCFVCLLFSVVLLSLSSLSLIKSPC